MYRVGGFPEYSPSEQIVFDDVLKIIKNCYSKFGYTSIETPAVERNEVLVAKSGQETGKQIFGLHGLSNQDMKEYSLHFDLTVPFARYVLDWENELTFPFKRSQIQKVWRGERTQKGRFKELYQADVDVIWSSYEPTSLSLGNISRLLDDENFFYDAEVIYVLYSTLINLVNYLKIDDTPYVHINNRKILNGFIKHLSQNLSGMSADEFKGKIMGLIDKYYKLTFEEFVNHSNKIMIEFGIDFQIATKLLTSLISSGIEDKKSLQLFKDYVPNAEFNEGLDELYNILAIIDKLGESFGVRVRYKVDFSIVRGLDYYTGTVFETYLPSEFSYGSICSGGRYENLTASIDSKRSYSGVGGSIGISRFMSYIFDKGIVDLSQKTVSQYLFLNFSSTFDDILRLAGRFSQKGANVEIYPSEEKFKKQLNYADKKGIPYVVILGENEKQDGFYKVKNMQTGEEIIKKIDF